MRLKNSYLDVYYNRAQKIANRIAQRQDGGKTDAAAAAGHDDVITRGPTTADHASHRRKFLVSRDTDRNRMSLRAQPATAQRWRVVWGPTSPWQRDVIVGGKTTNN